jgi:outer membrane biosynthesis protein TonB
MLRDDISGEERNQVKSIMPLVAVAMTFALSASPAAAAAAHTTGHEVSIVTIVDQPTGPGTPVRQTATVTDTGRYPLFSLRIHLDLAPGCAWFVALLVPGNTVTFTCDGTAGDTDSVVTATVSGHDLPGRGVAARSTSTLRVPHPAVRLDVAATPALAVPGEPVRYTLSVTNSGDDPLERLAVTATGSSWCDRTVPGPLAVGASATVECTATTGQQDLSTTFRLSGRDTFGNPVAATATVDVAVVVPGLTMTVSGPPTPTPAGHDVLITVRLADTSSVALSGLRITGAPVACDHELSWLAGGATVTYTCSTVISTRTIVTLMATAQPALDGIPVPCAESVTQQSTLVLQAAAPTPTPTPTQQPTPTPAPALPPIPVPAPAPVKRLAPTTPPAPAPRIEPAPTVAPPPPAPRPITTVAPTTSPSPVAAPAAPPRPPVTGQAVGPLANPGRTAVIIAVLAALVMTVSVGALAAATRPGK